MVWIVALTAAWFGAFVMLLALTSVAARSDRPTADHRALMRRQAAAFLPPTAERERHHPLA